jgi:hypothetical protein
METTDKKLTKTDKAIGVIGILIGISFLVYLIRLK